MLIEKHMKIAIVGCGVIGSRRAEFLPKGSELAAVYAPSVERAQLLAKKHPNCLVSKSLDELIDTANLKAVFVCTVNSALFSTTQKALDHGMHVLVEKPASRAVSELRQLNNPRNCVLKIGFNHRFHPAYEDLCAEIEKNPTDPIMYIRASYGNGARLGFEKEWRANPELSGGGELLDQGVHVLDLAGKLLPNLKVVHGLSRTQYWQMPVDDNTWGWLSTPQGQTFSFHVSSSEWKNEFRFEVYTQKRKYQWIGLGRSYGPEKLTIYKMTPEMGPPLVEERSYSENDDSWLKENTHFL